MTALKRKAILITDKFICHKKNGKGNTLIFSRNHPTAKFVRVVIDSGIDKTSGKIVSNAGVKLCYINRQKNWREITTEIFTDTKGLASLVTKVEAAEKFVKNCKHCKAKKFTAKSGNVVCANACWTAWAGKKKAATTKKKKPQKKITASTVKKTARNPQRKPQKKSSRKKLQKIVAEILPGDLVTVELLKLRKVTTDYTGSVLGIVTKVDQFGKVNVNWTANTSNIHDWEMPFTNHYSDDCREVMRFKVLSRPVEWAIGT